MNAQTTVAEAPPTATFTALDRCDADGLAQAVTEYRTVGGGALLLCKHHADSTGAKIVQCGGTVVRDERALLR